MWNINLKPKKMFKRLKKMKPSPQKKRGKHITKNLTSDRAAKYHNLHNALFCFYQTLNIIKNNYLNKENTFPFCVKLAKNNVQKSNSGNTNIGNTNSRRFSRLGCYV